MQGKDFSAEVEAAGIDMRSLPQFLGGEQTVESGLYSKESRGELSFNDVEPIEEEEEPEEEGEGVEAREQLLSSSKSRLSVEVAFSTEAAAKGMVYFVFP